MSGQHTEKSFVPESVSTDLSSILLSCLSNSFYSTRKTDQSCFNSDSVDLSVFEEQQDYPSKKTINLIAILN